MSNLRPEASGDAVSGRLVMVGAAIPQDVMDALMKADPVPQVQTHKLSWAVIRGIECTGRVVDLISTVAISDYPRSDWLWSGYRKWDRGNGSDNRLVPFINVLGLKQLTRFLGCVAMLIRWSIAHRGKERHVLLYGLISSHLYAVRCVRLLFAIKATVLITDLPGLAIPDEPWWKGILRPIDRSMVHHAVLSADGLIVLTRQIAEDFAPRVPAIVIEGIVSVESEELAKTMPDRESSRREEFVVLYAGGLQRVYGIPLLLEAFAELPGEDFRLCLLGRGDMEDEIRRRAEEDPRIHFPGLVAPDEAFRRSQEATVLINPRPSCESFTPYSFPSKLLEYMASGRPVITTRLPGIPAEYDSYVIWIDRETPAGLAALLRQLREQPSEQLDDLGRRGRDYVLQEKNHRQQGRRIVDFIEQINSLTRGKR
jgi:glycosyltransferase involved in cell wall biosynthesis